MSVFQTMITFHSEALGFYIKSNQGERELITGETERERERERIEVSIGAKFRKVVLENRVGVFTR
jgi:hypothetical protein